MVGNNLSYWPGNCRISTRNSEVVIRFAARFKYGVVTAPDGLPDLPEVVKLEPLDLLYYRLALDSKRVCEDTRVHRFHDHRTVCCLSED
jgi:hypothetical protein